MKRTLTAVLAALVLVAGAFTAIAITSGGAFAQTTDDESTSQERPDFAKGGEILEEVLASFVADGDISQATADDIAEAMAAKAAEVREQRQLWREDHAGRDRRGFKQGFRLGGFLEDGVIDADELAELPDDHPLKDPDGPAAKYLGDGKLTQEELQQLREELHAQRQAKRDAQAEGTST